MIVLTLTGREVLIACLLQAVSQQYAVLIKELEKRCDRRRPGDSAAVPIAKSDERQQARASAEVVDLQNESPKKNRS